MHRILFVCTGNTCRSPMAEAILKNRNVQGVEVKSAGVYASPGSDASEHAKSVLKEKGIVHEHTSRLLSETDLLWATHILTMTTSHKDAIVSQFPNVENKIFTLKEFAGEAIDHDVSDPFGGNLSHYQSTYNEMESLIRSVLERLNNEKQ